MALDNIDLRILSLMQTKANLSVAQIAEEVNLSQPPCWRRIKKLEAKGYIDGRVTMLNRKQLGLNIVVYTEVKLTSNGRQEVDKFEDEISSFPEVAECYAMLGRSDYLLRIVAKDMDDYDRFFRDHLSKIPGVQDITSAVALREVKYSTELPI